MVPASLFGGRTDENTGDGRGDGGGGKNGRSGSSSKRLRVPEAGDRAHSACFLMKTHLRHPHRPPGMAYDAPVSGTLSH